MGLIDARLQRQMQMCIRDSRHADLYRDAADTIEHLKSEIARMTAERDAAVACIKSKCIYTEDTEYGTRCDLNNKPCDSCADVWRGPLKGADNETN